MLRSDYFPNYSSAKNVFTNGQNTLNLNTSLMATRMSDSLPSRTQILSLFEAQSFFKEIFFSPLCCIFNEIL